MASAFSIDCHGQIGFYDKVTALKPALHLGLKAVLEKKRIEFLTLMDQLRKITKENFYEWPEKAREKRGLCLKCVMTAVSSLLLRLPRTLRNDLSGIIIKSLAGFST